MKLGRVKIWGIVVYSYHNIITFEPMLNYIF